MHLYQGPVRAATWRVERTLSTAAELLGLAQANMERQDFAAALFNIDIALDFVPNNPHAHWNKSQALLSLGNYVEGFKEFEWRRHLFRDPFAAVDVPLWHGEDLNGKRLLLHHEHGYGDSLMMLRYVPVLKAQGAIITLLLPTALVPLARQFDVDVRSAPPAHYGRFDYRCPMFSVLVGLAHNVSDIPPAPYITVPGTKRLSVRPNSIGIAWSGNRTHLRDNHRSIDIDQFLALLECKGKALHSVQNSEQDRAATLGVIADDFEDFSDTAELMVRLDHLVLVDTAAAHLAGAIGHPSAHVMLPYSSDWRWYNAQAWYPTIKVHRQDALGDWASAFAKVNRSISDG